MIYRIISNDGAVVAEHNDLEAILATAAERTWATGATARVFVGDRVRWGVEPSGEVWRIDDSGVPATHHWRRGPTFLCELSAAELGVVATALEHFLDYLADFGGKDYDPEEVGGLIHAAEEALFEVTRHEPRPTT
jgi:hypothetical protein